jgi:N-acetylmuramoyl-L-alanine amidase
MQGGGRVTLAVAAFVVGLAASQSVTVSLQSGERAVWRRGEAPALAVLARRGEGWIALASRVSGRSGTARELQAANQGRPNPLRDVRVIVPWELLKPELRVAVARAVFTGDRRVTGGWEHTILAPWGGDGESWWELAEWFCGDGSEYPVLREANPDLGLFPPRGTRVLVPESALLPEFRRLKAEGAPTVPPRPRPTATAVPMPPPTATPTATPTPIPSVPTAVATARPVPAVGTPGAVTGSLLTPVVPATATPVPTAAPVLEGEPAASLEILGEDAIYRLRPKEALYSAVVIRFTGLLHAADVNATAAEIARRSGISDVTSIPVGFPIKIPLELLLPEYLPAGHPRRAAWERERGELLAIKREIRAANLSGIHVILDAGHGGGDTGAIANGVWESTYVYDVMSRVRRVLREETKATVWATVRNDTFGDKPPDRDQLPVSREQRLLVDPPYDLEDSSIGVNLRWVLANSLLERLKGQKVNAERVVLVSIHADSLHPAVRGLMVYAPSRALRSSRGPLLRDIFSCREAKEMKAPRFGARFNARAEALSTELGETITRAATRYGVPLHPYQPVRSSVLRGGKRWVPAVLKYSLVPTSVLVEICNLNNEEDRELLLTAAFREKLAHAIAAGLAEGFSR